MVMQSLESGELKRTADGEPKLSAVEESACDAPPPGEEQPAAAVQSDAAAVLSPVVGERWLGVLPRRIDMLATGTLLCCSQGSVVAFSGDAIVNAANTGCLGGGGVDGAINDAGGRKLRAARAALPMLAPWTRCLTGGAVSTEAGTLSCKRVIHAVGPDYRDDGTEEECDALLASAYAAALAQAREHGCGASS